MNGDQEWSPYNCLGPVLQSVCAGFFGAMHTAINLATGFNAVADDLAITMRTGGRQHVNRTLEAIKRSSLSC
jgi:hypothetical protein